MAMNLNDPVQLMIKVRGYGPKLHARTKVHRKTLNATVCRAIVLDTMFPNENLCGNSIMLVTALGPPAGGLQKEVRCDGYGNC